jgi:hypothetical protein
VSRRMARLVASIAGLALVVVAQPAGAYNEALRQGTTGEYIDAIADDSYAPGVTCLFENNSGAANDELDKISVRKLYVHGPYAQSSTVGYRFIVKRQQPPFNGAYKTVYQSGITKKRGNTADPAVFPARTWTAPERTKARYRIQILLYWYAKGSTTSVIGKTRGLMETYQHRLTRTRSYVNGDAGSAGYCHPNYHAL